jgi:membrane protease YdiL (CAAX protease family)
MNMDASKAIMWKLKGVSYLNELIKRFSATVELIIVLITGFGLFIFSSTWKFVFLNTHLASSWNYRFTSFGQYSTVIYEAIALLIILYILKIRGWKTNDFNLTFTFKLIGVALLVMFVNNLITTILYKGILHFNVVNEATLKQVNFASQANWLSILLIIVINSFFEEFLLIGYLFKRLEKYHPVIIIGGSMLIRLS